MRSVRLVGQDGDAGAAQALVLERLADAGEMLGRRPRRSAARRRRSRPA